MGLALGSLGCHTDHLPYFKPASAPTFRASPDAATVVFVRPSGWGDGNRAFIIDGGAAVLAEVPAESAVGVSLPAGEHLLAVFLEARPPLAMFDAETFHSDAHSFMADVESGETYFVEVGLKAAPFVGTWADLFAVAPRRPSWPKLSTWLDESAHYDAAPGQGSAYFDADFPRTMAADARAHWEGLSEEQRHDRRLLPDDGR